MSHATLATSQPGVRTLRVAHVTATFPPYYGGTGSICYHNAHQLARLGHEVTVFTTTSKAAPDGITMEDGLRIVRLDAPFRLGNAPFTPALFGSQLSSFDLVHLHYPYYFGGEAVWRNHLRGTPYVVTYHQDVRLRGVLNLVVRLHHQSLGRLVLTGARLIMATSLDYAAHSRLAHLPRGRRQQVVEMPNGVDTDRFSPQPQTEARQALRIADGGPVVLFVGGLDPAHYFKGVSVLLAAFAVMQHEIGAARLVVVGEGDRRSAYEKAAQALGVADAVRFAGRVSEQQLPLYYAAADVVALPSTTEGEAFGVVLLEAMANARAVVASNLPGVRSVVNDEVDGLLARPGDHQDLATKLTALVRNPSLRHEMGAAGRRKVEAQYSWAQLTPRLVEYYRLALEGHRR